MSITEKKELTRAEKERLYLLRREKKLRLARTDLWEFCKLLEPDFYLEHRLHLKELCRILQDLYQKKITDPNTLKLLTDLILNLPPRHGKSRTLVNFCSWVLGVNPDEKILIVCSGDDLANDFSRFIRNMISKEKLNPNSPKEIVFSDVFPNTKIQKGNASVEKWALEGKFFTLLSAGYQSNKITGRGFTLIICDDLISGEKVALNPVALERINNFVSGTLAQRKEKGCMEIFNMTRWSDEDPCGVKLSNPKLSKYYYVFKIPVMNRETGEMLCPDLFDKDQYERAIDEINPLVFFANFFQEPITLKGGIYDLKTYDKLPDSFENILSYVDVADGGGDWLSAPVGMIEYDQKTGKNYVYITDWLHSDKNTDITEPLLVDMLINNKVDLCKIESNSGGRTFASNIQKSLEDNNASTFIETFAQKENKLGRILTNYSNINRYVYVPEDFWLKNKDAAKALYSFKKDARNKNDDAPDALTGLYEMVKNNLSAFDGYSQD